MSWNISFIGKPEKIVEALKLQENNLTGESRDEFRTACPHLVGLLGQNFNLNGDAPLIRLNASGHGTHQLINPGEPLKLVQSQCSVQMEIIYGKLLV